MGIRFRQPRAKSDALNAVPKEQRLQLERLPDDVITYLVQRYLSDFKTLCILTQVSQRLRRVAGIIIQDTILSRICLTTVMDQEGRSQRTLHYNFDRLNLDTLCATFAVDQTTTQRYRHDKTAAKPFLRHILVKHHEASAPLHNSWRESQLTRHDDCSFVQTSDNHKDNPILSDTDSHVVLNKPLRFISIDRPGLHTLESGQIVSADWLAMTDKIVTWQWVYHSGTHLPTQSQPPAAFLASQAAADVDKQRSERYITPLYLTVHLSMLLVPASKKRHHRWNKSMRWIKERYQRSQALYNPIPVGMNDKCSIK